MTKRTGLLLALALLLAQAPAHAANDLMETQQAINNKVKQQEQTIRALEVQLRDGSRELRHLLRGNDKLKAEVQTDLQLFHDRLQKAHNLRKASDELKKQIHAARLQKDLAAERALLGELAQNKDQQIESLQRAAEDLEAELTKVKGLLN